MWGHQMKRPLAVFTLIYFAVLAFSVCLVQNVNLTFSIMVTVLGIVAILIKPEFRRTVIILLILLRSDFW